MGLILAVALPCPVVAQDSTAAAPAADTIRIPESALPMETPVVRESTADGEALGIAVSLVATAVPVAFATTEFRHGHTDAASWLGLAGIIAGPAAGYWIGGRDGWQKGMGLRAGTLMLGSMLVLGTLPMCTSLMLRGSGAVCPSVWNGIIIVTGAVVAGSALYDIVRLPSRPRASTNHGARLRVLPLFTGRSAGLMLHAGFR